MLQFSGLKESMEKACPPSTQMVFIGVHLNSISLTLSITQERMNEIRILVSEWIQKWETTFRETVFDRKTEFCRALCQTCTYFYFTAVKLAEKNRKY